MQSRSQSSRPNQRPVPPTPRPVTQRSRRTYWSQRRRVAAVLVLLIVCAPLVTTAWYAWSITSAIGDAQDIAVVDLPERPASISEGPGIQQPQLPATPARVEPTHEPTEGPSSVDVARGLISARTGGESTSPSKVWPDKRNLNILVVGVDTRQDGGDQNADVIIIARLNLETRAMNSVSLPRDLLVEIPGHGEGKISGVYGIGVDADPQSRVGGIAKLRETIEHNFGIPIDDYVMIDFEGFKEVVDAIGGIDINVPTRIVDEAYPTEDYGVRTLIVEAGPQHMDGESALAYARTRHADSDDQRRERQMLVIRALFDKGQQMGTLTRVADLITALSGAVQTSFHWDQQLALAGLALNMDESSIHMSNIEQPLVQPGTTDTGAWVYVGDRDAISAFIESVLSGKEPASRTAPPAGS